MKLNILSTIYRMFGVASLIALMSALPIHAQPVERSTATIPFSFYAGGKAFAAGDYVIDSGVAGAIVSLKSLQSNNGALLPSLRSTNTSPGTPVLYFVQYSDGSTFLRKVSHPNMSNHFPPSKAERELDRETALARVRKTPIAIQASVR